MQPIDHREATRRISLIGGWTIQMVTDVGLGGGAAENVVRDPRGGDGKRDPFPLLRLGWGLGDGGILGCLGGPG